MHLGRWCCLPDFCGGVSDRGLLPAVDNDFRAHLREPDRGRKPDAARRTGDERGLSCQVEIHALFPNFFVSGYLAGGTMKMFQAVATPGSPKKNRRVVTTMR